MSAKVAHNKYATTVKIVMGILDRSLQLRHVTISLNDGYIPCFMLKVPIGHDYFITKHEYRLEFNNIHLIIHYLFRVPPLFRHKHIIKIYMAKLWVLLVHVK